MTEIKPSSTLRYNFGYYLFWVWNIIFLAFMTLGFAPRLLPQLLVAVRTAAIPAPYLIYALILTLIPVVAIILGLTVFRSAPNRLSALIYMVEGPLMVLLAVRLFLIREATTPITLILLIAGLGIGTFLWYLIDPNIARRGSLTGLLRLIGLTLMLFVSLYAAVWIAFYALPLIGALFRFIVETIPQLPRFISDLSDSLIELFLTGLVWVPFVILGFLLALFTGCLFAITPLVVPYLSIQAWWPSVQNLTRKLGWLVTSSVIVVVLLICCGVVIFSSQQPQQQAFTLLETPPETIADAQSLLEEQDSIRSGLLNAYLSPFRYMSALGEVYHIRNIYRDVFDLSEINAYAVQNTYERIASPLLYSPVHPLDNIYRRDNVAFQREPGEAAQLYQQFFDQTIVEGEHQEIVHAVRNTWSADQAESAWQAVDDREVYLLQQELNVKEHGDWAEVELHEVYQNQTSERQEVIYYFNLPESAVLTGVWLGESADRDSRFTFQVAPRGAAQAVYRNETRVMRDPALLEQIGPRQYRLRVYPVMPITSVWDDDRILTRLEDGAPLHMWMTYQVMASAEGWPLPQAALKRNVFWDKNTERSLNGAALKLNEDDWLPATVPVVEPATPQAHQVDLPGGQQVTAVPLSQVELPALPADLHLAIVVDRSHSMTDHADLVAAALKQLPELVGPSAGIDLYLTASPYRGESPSRSPLEGFDVNSTVYFGGQNAAELLAQFEELRGEDLYDAVLVLTDGSGYELGANDIEVPIPSAPVWMVHLGSDLPMGYDDATLQAIQASGGGVVADLDEALARLGVAIDQQRDDLSLGIVSDLLDGYLWTVIPEDQISGDTVESASSDPAFSAFAARHLILAEMQRYGEALNQVETLDQLHELAMTYGIVTPYSSMIVLVNSQQQQLLDHLIESGDRYQREFEELNDTTPSTSSPLTGVPEPHEWLLIGLAVVILLLYTSRRKLAFLRLNNR